MKNVLFDFDSTLIKEESLELILAPLLQDNKNKLLEIEKITNLGMQGSIGFRESLESRLAIASPTKDSIQDFIDAHCPSILTDGMQSLIDELHKNGTNVWIFSGGLADSIRPFADVLNIPRENVFAVEVNWNPKGSFKSLDNTNGACDSKLIAFENVKSLFSGEVIAVGDGYTDYKLKEGGYADKFIAYTEHVQRDNVIQKAELIAKDIYELTNFVL